MRSSSALGVAAAVAVAGQHVEVAVGPLDDRAQAAEAALQQRLVDGDPVAVEPQPAQALAAQRREQVVAASTGSLALTKVAPEGAIASS